MRNVCTRQTLTVDRLRLQLPFGATLGYNLLQRVLLSLLASNSPFTHSWIPATLIRSQVLFEHTFQCSHISVTWFCPPNLNCPRCRVGAGHFATDLLHAKLRHSVLCCALRCQSPPSAQTRLTLPALNFFFLFSESVQEGHPPTELVCLTGQTRTCITLVCFQRRKVLLVAAYSHANSR